MTRVLFVGQDPNTVDYSDPAIPPGTTAQKIQAGIDIVAHKIAEHGWTADICMIPPTDVGIDTLQKQLASARYDRVVIGGGLRLLLNAVHKTAPNAAIAFNTNPADTADAAARRLTTSSSLRLCHAWRCRESQSVLQDNDERGRLALAILRVFVWSRGR